MITLYELDMLAILPKVFDEIQVAWATVIELREEIERYWTNRHSASGWVALQDFDIITSPSTPEMMDDLRDRSEALLAWLEKAACLQGCPRRAMSPKGLKLREFLGPASYDAHALASATTPLYADDFVLRELTHVERGARSFSTYAFLEAVRDHGLISQGEFVDAVRKLLALNHRFVPVSADLLLCAIRADGLSLGTNVRSGLARLVEGDVESGAKVFGSFIKRTCGVIDRKG